MSKLKFSTGVFLEKQELDQWQRFVVEEGSLYDRKIATIKAGFVRDEQDEVFAAGRVMNVGNTAISIPTPIVAIDLDGRKIIQESVTQLNIPDDGQWYWLTTKYATSTLEKGKISIDTNGNVIGIGTQFTKLRGKSNFPSLISFPNASNNVLDYEVLEVIDDNNMMLSGIFSIENDLDYQIIGTFDKKKVPLVNERGIFEYDSSILSLVPEVTSQTIPVSVDTNYEFAIARVSIQMGQLLIHDKRINHLWSGNRVVLDNKEITDALIGVDSIRFDDISSGQMYNEIAITWGLFSSNWSIDANNNRVTLSAGSGGRHKSLNTVTDGEFDGWKMFLVESKVVFDVTNTTLDNTSVNLLLDSLDPTFFQSPQTIILVPNAEWIDVKFTSDSSTVADVIHTFPIHRGRATMPLLAYDATCTYTVSYRFYSALEVLPYKTLQDDTIGYYNEAAFDVNGIITTPTSKTTITNSIVEVKRSPSALIEFQNRIDLGDKQGWYEFPDLEALAVISVGRTIPIKVRVDKQYLFLKSTPLTNNIVLDISHVNAKSGNRFKIILEDAIDPSESNYQITIIGNGVLITPLATISASQLRRGDQSYEFVFDIDNQLWKSQFSDVSFRGYNHYAPTQDEYLDLSDANNYVLESDGKYSLIVSGTTNVIRILPINTAPQSFAYIKFRNGIIPNELYIAVSWQNNLPITLNYGGELANDILNGVNGGKDFYAFLSDPRSLTALPASVFHTIQPRETIHLALTRQDNFGNTRQGYNLLLSSHDRAKSTVFMDSNIVDSQGGNDSGAWDTVSTINLPDNPLGFWNVFATMSARISFNVGGSPGILIVQSRILIDTSSSGTMELYKQNMVANTLVSDVIANQHYAKVAANTIVQYQLRRTITNAPYATAAGDTNCGLLAMATT